LCFLGQATGRHREPPDDIASLPSRVTRPELDARDASERVFHRSHGRSSRAHSRASTARPARWSLRPRLPTLPTRAGARAPRTPP
jgi:hypothetical protein